MIEPGCFCMLNFCCQNHIASKAAVVYWSPCCWFCCSQGVAQAFQTDLPPLAPSPAVCSCVNRLLKLMHQPTGQQPLGSSPQPASQEIRKGMWKLALPERREKENNEVIDENTGEIDPNSSSNSTSRIGDCSSLLSLLLAPN